MYRNLILLAVALILVAGMVPAASAASAFGHGFAWFNDDDGDGIPNGQDPDWIRPLDGSGYKFRHGLGVTVMPRSGPAASGNTYQHRFQYRHKSGAGTCIGTNPLQIRLRLRDGSCR
jgi:hypothetical protein